MVYPITVHMLNCTVHY